MEHLFFDLFLDGLEPITVLSNDAIGEVFEHKNLYNANWINDPSSYKKGVPPETDYLFTIS